MDLTYGDGTNNTTSAADFAMLGITFDPVQGAELAIINESVTVAMNGVTSSTTTPLSVTAVANTAIVAASPEAKPTMVYTEDQAFSATGLAVRFKQNNEGYNPPSGSIAFTSFPDNSLGLFIGSNASTTTTFADNAKLSYSTHNGKHIYVKSTTPESTITAYDLGVLTVNKKTPDEMTATFTGGKADYIVDQNFDPTKMVLTVTHSETNTDSVVIDEITTIDSLPDTVKLYVRMADGHDDVPPTDTLLESSTKLTADMNGKKVIAKYTYNNTTVEAEVCELTVVAATIKSVESVVAAPDKMKYIAGDAFNTEGMTVSVKYTNDTTATISFDSTKFDLVTIAKLDGDSPIVFDLAEDTIDENHNNDYIGVKIKNAENTTAKYYATTKLTVAPKHIYSIEIDEESIADKLTYTAGLTVNDTVLYASDMLDFTGMKLKTRYGNDIYNAVGDDLVIDNSNIVSYTISITDITSPNQISNGATPVEIEMNNKTISVKYKVATRTSEGDYTYPEEVTATSTAKLSVTQFAVDSIAAVTDATGATAYTDSKKYSYIDNELVTTGLYVKLVSEETGKSACFSYDTLKEKSLVTLTAMSGSTPQTKATLTYIGTTAGDTDDKSCEYNITRMVGLAVDAASAPKTAYIENETISVANITIHPQYKTGTAEAVTDTTETLTTENGLTFSVSTTNGGEVRYAVNNGADYRVAYVAEDATHKLTGLYFFNNNYLFATYGHLSVEITQLTVGADYVTGISFTPATQKPTKNEYVIGEQLDLTGMKIYYTMKSTNALLVEQTDWSTYKTDLTFFVGSTEITDAVRNGTYKLDATTAITVKYVRTNPTAATFEATLPITISKNDLASISVMTNMQLNYFINSTDPSSKLIDMSGLSITPIYKVDPVAPSADKEVVSFNTTTPNMTFFYAASDDALTNGATTRTPITHGTSIDVKQADAYTFNGKHFYVTYEKDGIEASAYLGVLAVTDRAIASISQAATFPGSFCIVEGQGWESVMTGNSNDNRETIPDDTVFLQIAYNDAPSVKIDVTKNDLKSTVNTYGINVDFALSVNGDGKSSLATTDKNYYLRFKSANGIPMIANSYPVDVLARAVTGVAIKTQPSDLAYVKTEPIKLDGIVVTLTWNDGVTNDIALAEFGTNGLSAKIDSTPITSGTTEAVVAMNGKPITITHTPSSKTATTQNVSVEDRKVTGITVKTAPTKMEYIAGQPLDLIDLEITKTYNSQAEVAGTYDTAEVNAGVIFSTNSGYTVSVDSTTISNINNVATTDAMNGKAIKILYAGTASDPVNGASVDCTTTSTLRITPLRVTAVAFVGQPTVDASNLLQLDDVTVQLTYNDTTKANTPIAYINCAEAGLTFTIDGKIAADEMQLTKAAHDGKKVRVSYKYSDTLCAESTALTVKDVVSTDNSLYMVKLTYEGETYIGSISGYGISFGIPTEVNFTQIGDSNFSIIPKDSKATHTTLTPGSSGTFTFTIEAENGTKSDAYTITVTSNVSSDTAAEEEAKALKALINGNLDKDVEGSMIVGSTEDDKQAALKEILENRVNRIIADSGLTGYTAEVTLGESYNDFDFDSDGTFAGATITLKRNNASIVNLDPISNVGGTISATGTVNPQVNVTSDATGAFVPLNTEVILTATPNGDFKTTDPVITYQWYYAPSNGTPDVLTGEKIIGETNSTFTTSSATAQTKYVFCVATGESVAGVAIEKTSAMITLTFGEIYREPIAGKPILDNNGSTITKIGEVASATKTYSVIARKLNIRTGMSTSFKKVGTLSYGDLVQVKTINGDWSMIEINGIDRFVNNKYLRPVDLGTEYNGLVTPRVLNVRSGPGTTYSKLGRLTRNTPVRILELKDGWYKIVYGDSVAYVSSKYIQVTMPITGTSNVVKGTVA